MRSRRFTILAAVLVTLNVALWLVPQGQALRGAVIGQLFGSRLIRAEVVVQGTTTGTTEDYLIDRGVIVAITPGGITLKEADGRLQPISIATGTRVTGVRRGVDVSALRTNLRVLVFRLANGPAETIQVEGRGAAP